MKTDETENGNGKLKRKTEMESGNGKAEIWKWSSPFSKSYFLRIRELCTISPMLGSFSRLSQHISEISLDPGLRTRLSENDRQCTLNLMISICVLHYDC